MNKKENPLKNFIADEDWEEEDISFPFANSTLKEKPVTLKGIPKLKPKFSPLKGMNILRYIAFSKIIFNFPFTLYWLFSTLKKKPSRSRRSASGVREKCIRGQGEVRQNLRRSALGVKEKCAGGQGKGCGGQ